MQEQELAFFAPNQRAAIAALTDSGISDWDAPDAGGFAIRDEFRPGAWSGDPVRPQDRRQGAAEPGGNTLRYRAHRAWSLLRLTLISTDLLFLLATPLVCHRLYLGYWFPDAAGLAFIELSCLFTMCCLHLAGGYTREALRHADRVWQCVLLAEVGALVAVLGFDFVSRGFNDLSRFWVMVSWGVSGLVLFSLHRLATMLVGRIMRTGQLRERVAIVCAGRSARMVLEKFKTVSSPEVSIVGIFDDRKARLPADFEGYEVKGDTDELLSYVRQHGVDRVIIAMPWTAERRIVELVAKLRQTPVRVDLIPHNLMWEFSSDLPHIQDVPVITVANRLVDAQMDWLKRAEDLVLGSALLVIATPIMLAVAIAVRLDSPGPALFRQRRSGYNNQVIDVVKFRSMYANGPADPDVRQATKEDPRVTRVGRFIRRTSLDELPQLFHVLTGAMSLVGPRPHAVPHNNHFGPLVEGYFARHNVKPGITGWAQINGHRGETDTVEKMHGRVRYDLDYIERWSLLLDLKIILLTAFRVWFQKTAY